MMILKLRNVTLFNDTTPLFQPISFSLHQGECLSIYGNNGVGKTSLMNAIFQNDFKIGEFEIFIGINEIIFQNNSCMCLNQLTIKENLQYLKTLSNISKSKIQNLTILFSEKNLLNKKMYELSRGQKQIVSIHFFDLLNAKLWLLDEPDCHLDKNSILEFDSISKNFLERGGAIIMTNHYRMSEKSIELKKPL